MNRYALLLPLTLLTTSTAIAGFDGGSEGLVEDDLVVGEHTPANRGSGLIHTVTELEATADACPGLALTYSIQQDFTFQQHAWTWESPVFDTEEEVTITWQHSGNHLRFRSTSALEVEALDGGASVVLHSGRTLNDFFKQGLTTILVEADQSLEISVRARSFDRSNSAQMGGTVEIRPVVCEETNQPPVCDGATPSLDFLWPANHTYSTVEIVGVIDPDGDDVTIAIDAIYQDEEVLDGNDGSGSTSPDAQIGTITVTDENDESVEIEVAELRAERAGNYNGRYYHVDFSAEDGMGGSCTGTVRVGVPHNQGSKGAPVDDGPLYDATAE